MGQSTPTSVTVDELRTRVAHALERAPLCRGLNFDILVVGRPDAYANWTVNLHGSKPTALLEAYNIVHDIQQAYVLSADAFAPSAMQPTLT